MKNILAAPQGFEPRYADPESSYRTNLLTFVLKGFEAFTFFLKDIA
jgi:hypothetical protein